MLLGRCTIRILAATELHDTNHLTRMDPYVELKLMNPAPKLLHTTKPCKNGARTPKWDNEQLTIDVFELHDHLQFTVLSDNKVKANSLIGEKRVTFRDLMRSEGQHEHYLFRKGDKHAGKLLLDIKIERLVQPKVRIEACR